MVAATSTCKVTGQQHSTFAFLELRWRQLQNVLCIKAGHRHSKHNSDCAACVGCKTPAAPLRPTCGTVRRPVTVASASCTLLPSASSSSSTTWSGQEAAISERFATGLVASAPPPAAAQAANQRYSSAHESTGLPGRRTDAPHPYAAQPPISRTLTLAFTPSRSNRLFTSEQSAGGGTGSGGGMASAAAVAWHQQHDMPAARHGRHGSTAPAGNRLQLAQPHTHRGSMSCCTPSPGSPRSSAAPAEQTQAAGARMRGGSRPVPAARRRGTAGRKRWCWPPTRCSDNASVRCQCAASRVQR